MLVSVTLSLALLAPQPQKEIQTISIREWAAPRERPAAPPLGSFLVMPDDADELPVALIGASQSNRVMDPQTVLDLVRDFAPVEWDSMSLYGDANTLQVSGPSDKVNAVMATAQKLRSACVHEVQIQVELYRVAAGASIPAVASADRLEALRRDHQRIWSAQSSCAASQSIGFQKDRASPYVRDSDIEVAKNAQIGDPIVERFFEGVRLIVEPHVLAGSTDLVVFAQFAVGEQRGPLQRRASGSKDLASMQVPNVDCSSGTFSGRVPDGGALVLSMRGDPTAGSDLMLLVRAKRGAGADAAIANEMGIYPVSALLSDALRVKVVNELSDVSPSSPQLSRREDDGSGFGPRNPDVLGDVLASALGDAIDQLRIEGGHVILRGAPAATKEAVARLLAGLEQQWVTTAQIDLRTTLEEPFSGDGVFPRGEGTPSGTGSRILHHVSFPVVLGRPHVLLRGHMSTAVRDADVEIAEKAALSNPVVDDIFSGVIVSLLVYPGGNGPATEATVDLIDVPTLESHPRETESGVDLYLPRVSRARLSHTGAVTLGQDVVLGEGPNVKIGEQSFRTRQVLRIAAP